MKILIENQETSEYLTETGVWTKNPMAAKPFASSRLAFRAAKQEAIGKFNIVGLIPSTRQFVNLNHGRGTGHGVETSPGELQGN